MLSSFNFEKYFRKKKEKYVVCHVIHDHIRDHTHSTIINDLLGSRYA